MARSQTQEGRVVTPVTDRQRAVYSALCNYWALYGVGPSIRDLCAAVGIGTPNGVIGHLAALEKKGLVVWDRDKTARGVWPAGLKERIATAVLELETTCGRS